MVERYYAKYGDNDFRAQQLKRGIQPKNHMKDNMRELKHAQMKMRDKGEEDARPAMELYKLSQFKDVAPRLYETSDRLVNRRPSMESKEFLTRGVSESRRDQLAIESRAARIELDRKMEEVRPFSQAQPVTQGNQLAPPTQSCPSMLIMNDFIAREDTCFLFHQFVHGLINHTVNNNTLSLGSPNAFLFNEEKPSPYVGSTMFLRPVYTPLIALIDEGLSGGVSVIITGTPGVGKTTMRNLYVKHQLFRPFDPTEQLRTIILQNADRPEYFKITMKPISPPAGELPHTGAHLGAGADSTNVQVRVTATTGLNYKIDTSRGMPVGEIFRLVDVNNRGSCALVNSPDYPQEHVVVFTYPSNTVESCFDKAGVLRYFMPLWTLSELKQANTALNLRLADAVIEDRYDKVGGTARWVLAKLRAVFDQYVNMTLKEKASDPRLLETASLIQRTTFSGSQNFIHALAYFFVKRSNVGEYDFTQVSVNWGTKFIAVEVVGEVWRRQLTNKGSCVHHSSIGDNPSLVGFLFEGWSLRLLQLGGLSGMRWVAEPVARGSLFARKKYFGDGRTCKSASFPINSIWYFFTHYYSFSFQSAAPSTRSMRRRQRWATACGPRPSTVSSSPLRSSTQSSTAC